MIEAAKNKVSASRCDGTRFVTQLAGSRVFVGSLIASPNPYQIHHRKATDMEKQPFLGGLIGGILVKKGVEFAIDKAIDRVAKSPSLSLEKEDAPAVKEIVKLAVEKEVQSQVAHQTNTEAHWYQKRSFWSAIVSIGVVVLGPALSRYGLNLSPAMQEFVSTVLTTGGGLWAAYIAARAGIATKPLGE